MKKNSPILAPAHKKNQRESYLTIELIDSSPRLARMLPSQLARHCRAIPIAAGLNKVTIAMADPEDASARAEVLSAFSTPAIIVKADPRQIDSLIAEYYPSLNPDPLRILAWQPEYRISQDQQGYIHSFARILNADLSWMESGGKITDCLAILQEDIQIQGTDLLVCPSSALQTLISPPAEKKLLKRLSVSILSLKTPRWPIQQILLVLQDDRVDDFAIEWAVRVASACQACLTILPVIPAVPPVYGGMQGCLTELLDSNCQLGKRLRQIAHRLNRREIQGTFKVRDEPADWQLHWEVEEGDYDLVIAGTQYHNPAQNLLAQDLICPLLFWTIKPVLLAQNYPQGK